MKKKGQFFSAIVLIAVVSLLLNAYLLQNRGFFDKKEVVNTTMTREDFDSAGGYYIHDKYYCVWTQGVLPSTIEDAKLHEQCHWLVDDTREGNQYNHFCGVG